MLLRKNNRELSIMEVIDNLVHMAEIDWRAAQSDIGHLSWRAGEHEAFNRERIKNTFHTLFKYLKELYENDKGLLREEPMQQALQAMMLLAIEAVERIDQHTPLFKGDKIGVAALEEFKGLQQFYLSKIEKHYQGAKFQERWTEQWHEKWGEGQLLGTLESVRKDRNYELFLIRKEDGTPFFNRALLRHMHLVAAFEHLLRDPTQEDPFLRLEIVVDRNAHLAAKQILQQTAVAIDEFLKEAGKFKRIPLVAALLKALMALMLAANPRNLIENTLFKTAKDYYRDFHEYLRKALETQEYNSAAPRSSQKFTSTASQLAQLLATSFFMKTALPGEIVRLIFSLIEQGREGAALQSQTSSPLVFWNRWKDDDHALRYSLYQMASGPLAKITNQPLLTGFDPILQQHLTEQLYIIKEEELHISVYRMGCPVFQEVISKSKVVKEFEEFLNVLALPSKNQRYLMINLQDSTSWKEHARCAAIEGLAEHKKALTVITLPMNTEVYYQEGAYRQWDDAKEFMKLLKEQVSSGEQCGFYFPQEMDRKKLLSFTDEAIKTIYLLFFESKTRLTHQNRLDFIEIFYLLLILKWIEEFKPDLLSFSCKDGIDTGSCMSSSLYAFLRMMNDPLPFSKEEKEALFSFVYMPALTARFRPVDIRRFERMINALSLIQGELEASRAKIVSHCSKLYKRSFFKNVNLG